MWYEVKEFWGPTQLLGRAHKRSSERGAARLAKKLRGKGRHVVVLRKHRDKATGRVFTQRV